MRRHPAAAARRQPKAVTPQGVYNVTNNTTLAEDMATMERALTELQYMFQQDVDIHTFTRPIGAICNQVFLPIDRKYEITQFTTTQFEQVAEEIMTLANTQRDPQKVQTVLNSIRANKDKEDGETHLHVMTLLVKIWELSKKVGYTNAQDLILDNLRHNKDTGGGCYPGIAARLVQLYSVFINTMMKNRQNAQARTSQTSTGAASQSRPPVTNEDAELAAAIEASLVTQRCYTPSSDANVVENDELALALAMSLEQPAPRQSQEAIEDDAALAEALQRSLIMQ